MSKINVLQRAATLRQHADRLTVPIGNQRQRANASDANELERVQRLLRAMADHLDTGDLDPFLLQVRTPAQVEALLIYETMPTPDRETFQRLTAAGLDATSFPYAKAALLALDKEAQP
jgi:hypothetical protein